MARAKAARRAKSPAKSGTAPLAAEDLRILTRDAALAALTRLAELAKSEDERVALAASQELLNRAFGKSATAASDDQSHTAQPLVIKIMRFGGDDTDEPRTTSSHASGAKP